MVPSKPRVSPGVADSAPLRASRRAPRRAVRFDSLEPEVFLNGWRTYDRLRVLEDEVFGRFGLTPQQYNALRLLAAQHPEPLQTLTLANRLVSRAPDITRMLDKLEERGLVLRERHADDRRVVRVRISEPGRELIRETAGPLAECHGRQLGHMSAASLRSLCALLKEARRPHEADGGPWK